MLAALLRARGMDLAFNMLEIGARPLEGPAERFYRLVDAHPSSRLSGVEIDPQLCERLNREAPAGFRYYACALGKASEKRRLYETAHPMCSSLYPPDERYIDFFEGLESQKLSRTSELATVSLDQFASAENLGVIDFLKIDIQGAELDVFEGAADTLRGLLFVVCEVEFVPLYRGQPLFGDVDAWLRKHGLMFHKFAGIAWRMMKPFGTYQKSDRPTQFLWGDALFIRNLFDFDGLSGEQLLKLAVLFDLYESNDMAMHLLQRYDRKHGSDLGGSYLRELNAAGVWKTDAS